MQDVPHKVGARVRRYGSRRVRRWWGRRSCKILVASVVLGLGCRQALNTVFDVPPPKSEPADEAAAPDARRTQSGAPWWLPEDTVRPPIESTLNRDSVTAMLPRDHAGNIDWVAALREGTIRPRATLPGEPVPPPTDFQFGFDFVFPGPDTLFDAVFPHSVHTEWLACQQCHMRIFRYRNTAISMGEIFQGKYCGECHGKVAFPLTTGCERCHRSLSQPPNRAKPDLLGDIVMQRAGEEPGRRLNVSPADLLPAVFPHWVHRVRFRCKVCHLQLFEPRAGANPVTMPAIAEGKFCGRCHNGRDAFPATITTCQRCHVAPEAASGG